MCFHQGIDFCRGDFHATAINNVFAAANDPVVMGRLTAYLDQVATAKITVFGKHRFIGGAEIPVKDGRTGKAQLAYGAGLFQLVFRIRVDDFASHHLCRAARPLNPRDPKAWKVRGAQFRGWGGLWRSKKR